MKRSSLNSVCGFLLGMSLLMVPSYSFSKISEDQFTDKINNTLRTVNEKGEIDEDKASLAEVLVSKNEAKALEQLNKLLSKYKGSPLEPNLLFRKAELYVRQSKSARFFEFNRDNKILTLLPKSVKSGSSQSKLRDAVEIYEQIQRRHPNYTDLDLVMFNNAFIRQQLDQEKIAERIYRDILKKFPESYLIPDTHMSLAEMLYKNRRFQDALVEYEAIKKYPLARVYTYALYKTGWTKYQLKDVDGAIQELELVIKVSEQNLIGEGGNKISLKSEALTDLVLFYPEAFEAKRAFAYFKKLAGEDVGKYIVSLAQLYESHSKYDEFETVLNDLISGMPKSPHAPVAFKFLIESDLVVKSYEKSARHVAQFEKHCRSHFSQSFRKKKQDVKVSDEGDVEQFVSCADVLLQQSLKVATKWHQDWQNKTKKLKEANPASLSKKDSSMLDSIAAASELAYEVYLRSSENNSKTDVIRYSYADLLFTRKKFRLSSEQYFIVSQSVKDEKMLHDSSYYAIVSLESAIGEKWSDLDEDRYLVLAKNYIDKNPKGQYVNDITFKRSFIAYEKGRYDESLDGFKKLGWNKAIDAKIAIKAQDLYLDILNIQKKYESLMNSSFELIKMTQDENRKAKLEKIYRESFFSYATELQTKGKLEESASLYEKFYQENIKSNLADKALWNLIQIYIKQSKLHLAADKSLEYYQLFPKAENAKKALEKSAELYEYLGQTRKVAQAASLLEKADSKNALKWQKVAADFEWLSGETHKSVQLYKELLKQPDIKLREDVIVKLKRLSNPNKEVAQLMAKYDKDGHYSDILSRAKSAYASGNYAQAFKLASDIVGEKSALREYQAEARFIQAEILAQEFFSQSVKTKVERLEIVLTLKTEKLDKAQRAYQSAIKYGIPDVSSRAFLKLASIYAHYVDALKNIQITEAIPEKDKQVLLAEIEKIAIPIEEKIADTLSQGIDFVKRYPDYSDVSFELRNELSKINYKGNRYVKYNLSAPKVALPAVN